jgi:hypothetical protein
LAIIHPAPRFAVEEMSIFPDDVGPEVGHRFTSLSEIAAPATRAIR